MSRYYEESILWGRFVRYTCLACGLRSNWFSTPRLRKRLRSLSSIEEPVNLRKFWVGLHKPHCAASNRRAILAAMTREATADGPTGDGFEATR